jgi:adenosylcobinamide-phosphate synthase
MTMTAELLLLSLPLAMALDMIFGDPTWLPHPVRWMGKAIEWTEPRFRSLPFSPKRSGALMAFSLIVLTWTFATMVVTGTSMLHPVFGLMVQTLLLFTCISARGLADAAMSVYLSLKSSGISEGRKAVSMIVGREVEQLDENGVSRAAVETVAENLVDGFASPLFFFLIGGVPLALTYKMVNTLDSMIGYKNERYLYFGRFAAHVDDFANFLPARLVVPFIALTSQFLNGRGRQTLKISFRDGRRHASPNAGYPEAAFAGALGLWLGGANYYHGALVEKPVIGEGLAPTSPHHIKLACSLMLVTSIVLFMVAAAVLFFNS